MASDKKENETDKYFKGLVSTVGHLLGLREDRHGNLKATCLEKDETEKDDSCVVSIDNVSTVAAQQWEAGALLKTVAEMKIFTPATVQKIQGRINEVSKGERKPPPPGVKVTGGGVPVKPGTVNGGGIPAKPVNFGGVPVKPVPVPAPVAKDQQNPFAFSKNPSGFYPPRRVPSEETVSTVNRAPNNPTEIQPTKQFTFGRGKPIERNYVEPQNTTGSLFSDYQPPPAKRPALGISKNFPSHSSGYNQSSNNPPNTLANVPKENDSLPGPGSAFKTARELLLIDDKKKGIQRSLPPAGGGGGGRTLGLSKPPPKIEDLQKITKPRSSDDESKTTENPEVLELMEHDSMKNIDAKMVEAILNEVMDIHQTNWDDIAGLHGVKQIIREIIIWPMERPELFAGIRTSARGILFFGPPGTGKTMFGRVIATESRSTFFNISASSLTSKWIGEGEKMVRALFAVARLKQPSVIFIDEIDSILSQRSDSEHESSRRMKTEFLVQFDGCATSSEDRMLVIGVTNRPQELDEAARRRLVKRIYIPLPDFEARKQLVKRLVQREAFEMTEEDFNKVAKKTQGYSGADMMNLAKEAALIPLRQFGPDIRSIKVDEIRSVTFKDFKTAMKQVKSSVAPSDVVIYENWDRQFGCQHAGSAPTSEAEDTDTDDDDD